MGWADRAKEALRRGETVQIRPRGHSMRPKVHDGDLVSPTNGARFQIGNNRGYTNGQVGAAASFGRAVKVESG